MRLPSVTSTHAGGLCLAGVRLGAQLLACPSAGGLALLSLSASARLPMADLVLDAPALVRRLVCLGFRLDLNHAQAIARILWTAWGQDVALGPDGWQTVDAFLDARRREALEPCPAGCLPQWALPRWQRTAMPLPPVPAPHADAGRCASW